MTSMSQSLHNGHVLHVNFMPRLYLVLLQKAFATLSRTVVQIPSLPFVPQEIIASSNIPHRPTFYKQNSPIDRSGEDEGYSVGTDDFQSQAHYAHHRQSSGSTLTEALPSSIAQQYRSTAAHECSAFGIPPSESDEFHYKAEQSFIQPPHYQQVNVCSPYHRRIGKLRKLDVKQDTVSQR